MPSVNVDAASAKSILLSAWEKLGAKTTPKVNGLIAEKIHEVLGSRVVTFKYILITGLLAKLTNPQAHPRSLQASSTLEGAYDARSLGHGVVVPFEKTCGNLFGLSNEPFLSKPARHAEHRRDNPQLKYKGLAGVLHDLLDHAADANRPEVEAMLIECLRIGKERTESEQKATFVADYNLDHVVNFVREFLTSNDGGSRLAAVTGAFVRLLGVGYTVKVYPPSASDTFSKTAGDIEVFSGDALLTAYECKHRLVTVSDIEHGFRKAKERGVPEYCFVVGEGMGGEADVRNRVSELSLLMDFSLLEISTIVLPWAVAINPQRRSLFGNTVVDILREEMRRAEVANQAAELWNSLKK